MKQTERATTQAGHRFTPRARPADSPLALPAELTESAQKQDRPVQLTQSTLSALLDSPDAGMRAGPVAMIFDEDGVALAETLAHALRIGFRRVLLFSAQPPLLDHPDADRVRVIPERLATPAEVFERVNQVIAALPGTWLHYGYNAEFLIYPFFETRSVAELLTFHTEEQRQSMLTYTIDLYAGDLTTHPNGVDLDSCYMDKAGYYAEIRHDRDGTALDRQWDFRGGLRWRFEEHVSPARRKIDRISLFLAKPGLKLLPDHTLNDAEMNTVGCMWHHNITACLCSFRAAKALRANPGSRDGLDTFVWPNSTRFGWTSQELMDLGLMEPGQWF